MAVWGFGGGRKIIGMELIVNGHMGSYWGDRMFSNKMVDNHLIFHIKEALTEGSMGVKRPMCAKFLTVWQTDWELQILGSTHWLRES